MIRFHSQTSNSVSSMSTIPHSNYKLTTVRRRRIAPSKTNRLLYSKLIWDHCHNDLLSSRNVPLCASDKEDIAVKKNFTKQTPGHTSELVLVVQLDAGTPSGSSWTNAEGWGKEIAARGARQQTKRIPAPAGKAKTRPWPFWLLFGSSQKSNSGWRGGKPLQKQIGYCIQNWFEIIVIMISFQTATSAPPAQDIAEEKTKDCFSL